MFECCPSKGCVSTAKAAARRLGGTLAPTCLKPSRPFVTSITRLWLPVQLAGAVGCRAWAVGSAPVPPQLSLSSRAHPWQCQLQLQSHTFPLLPSMVSADFCTAAVLISTGAVLGRVNPVQMLLLALLEVTMCTLNEYILLSLMGVSHRLGSHQKGSGHGFRLLMSRSASFGGTNPLSPLPARCFSILTR